MATFRSIIPPSRVHRTVHDEHRPAEPRDNWWLYADDLSAADLRFYLKRYRYGDIRRWQEVWGAGGCCKTALTCARRPGGDGSATPASTRHVRGRPKHWCAQRLSLPLSLSHQALVGKSSLINSIKAAWEGGSYRCLNMAHAVL